MTEHASAKDAPSRLDLLGLFVKLQGLPIEQAQLMRRLDTSVEILTTAHMLDVLVELGLEARLVQGRFRQFRAAVPPMLVSARDGAPMLVGRVEAEAITVQRVGSNQTERLTRKEFESLWSGEWIEATPPTQAASKRFGVSWFIGALRKYRSLISEVVLASLFVQLVALATPLIFQVVIDKVLTHRTLTTLDVLVVALIGLSLFEVLLGALRHYLLSHTTNRVDLELGVKLFDHLLKLPLSYFETRRAGDTVARVRELENARQFLTGSALTSVLDLVFTVVFIAVMFYYSPFLGWIVVASLPVFFAASLVTAPLLRRKLEDKFSLGAENQSFLVETVTSMETIKGQAVERSWRREWQRRLSAYIASAFQGGHLANLSQQFIGFASKALTVVLLWVGAKLVIEGQLTVGGLIAFNMLAGRVSAPIIRIAQLWQEFQQMRVSIQRLADILDSPTEPASSATHAELPAMRGRVVFEHVTFRYRPDAPEVLTDISFEANPGEVIGVVGVSGSGKTTLLRLIQRLHTPTSGRVLIDGVDVGMTDPAWLRRQMGVVSQDAILFNRSVRDNIALGDLDVSMERIVEAATLAGADEFIRELPQHYNAIVGERGSLLSGGQRARLAIARALVHNPKLLLLDEATAALDYESERLIHENLSQIRAGRTVFIVAHRLPTLKLANRILVLERGRLVEEGSHQELIKRVGRYSTLYRLHTQVEGSHV